MGGRTQSTESVASLRRAVARLERKVSLLERVLTPEASPTGASGERLQADYAREVDRARREALDDYNYQEQLAMYRKTPGLLERMREVERKRNAFLEERGLPPEPSHIPKEILDEERAASSRTPPGRRA
ncbi:MAG: hypothetical protein AB7O67_07575 [Vicinamibacterales bacterium]